MLAQCACVARASITWFSCPRVMPDSPVEPTGLASCPQSWSASAASAMKGKGRSSKAPRWPMRTRATPEPIRGPFGTHGPGHDHESYVVAPCWLAAPELGSGGPGTAEPQRERGDHHGG